MITVQSVNDRIVSALDASGSTHYNFNLDILPGILNAVDYLQSVINNFMAEKKFSEELMRELTYVRVFQTNAYRRWVMQSSNLGHAVWTIYAVLPIPVVEGASPAFITLPDGESRYRADLSYLSTPYKTAARATAEEWDENLDNPFAKGSTITTSTGLASFAYINWSDYNNQGGGYSNPEGVQELEIRGSVDMARKFVAVRYAREHPAITLITDNILFPEALKSAIVDVALLWIARKQGDNTTIWKGAEKQLATLIQTYM